MNVTIERKFKIIRNTTNYQEKTWPCAIQETQTDGNAERLVQLMAGFHAAYARCRRICSSATCSCNHLSCFRRAASTSSLCLACASPASVPVTSS